MTNVTKDLQQAIRDRYRPPDWQVAFEVQFPRDEGGLRFADAIAIATRKGTGFSVHGFELKVSRADWLTERADPSKAAPAMGLVDYWWVVEGTPGIVQPEELQPGVGLLSLTSVHGFATTQHAALRNHDGKNSLRPIDRALVAAFLRRLDPMEPRTYWEMRVRRAEERGFAKGRSEQGRMTRARLRRGEPSDEEWPTP